MSEIRVFSGANTAETGRRESLAGLIHQSPIPQKNNFELVGGDATCTTLEYLAWQAETISLGKYGLRHDTLKPLTVCS